MTKRFGSLVANDHIDLVVQPGEILALLGENGAGKTTLMNVLYGLMQPDEGEILIDDKPAAIRSPKDAINAGIGMVHQHFMLVPVFTVAENVTLGTERVRRARTPAFRLGGVSVPSLSVPTFGLLDRRRARRDVLAMSERYGLQVNPDAYVEDIPVGVQQRVEIIKALLRNANVLVLDEPTAVLTPNETEDLFRIMRELREGGRSIIFISHKLKEVQAIADNITVIRRGAVVGQRPPSTSDSELAALMVGRSVQLRVSKEQATPGDVRLQVNGLTVPGVLGGTVVNDLSFEVRGGEILGIAGVQGNGQTDLCEALMGLRPSTGAVLLDGRDISHLSTRDRLRSGIGYIPEDRKEDGLVEDFSVAENLVLDVYDRPPYASGFALDLGAIRKSADTLVADYDVRTTSVQTRAGTLSGGNQQKVIVAREVSRDTKVLLASQPTRGLDVGSIEFVHKRIVAERDGGAAVVIVSSELDEIYALADRIAVMYEGKIVGFCPPDTPETELGLMMTGAGAAEAHARAEGAVTRDGFADAADAAHQQDTDEALELPGSVQTDTVQTDTVWTGNPIQDRLSSPGQPGSEARPQEPEQ
ncbi:MAG: ABC transporter ATP-binding protein [Nocardiopsaceae bacterium]|nr:ABC transporter ATP-binding protein [Nocardiopsaceae bacterium]